AVLSHELRSPLNPILGWARLLRIGRLNAAKTSHALEIIERNAQLQTQLIEDLLDVSRILQGKLSLTMAPVDLAAVIEAALETVRLAAEAKSIEVRWEAGGERRQDCEPISLTVLGDAARLQQVAWNLLSNAVKFTPTEGRVEVKLALVTGQGPRAKDHSAFDAAPSSNPTLKTGNSGQAADNPFAQITVTDTGKGIHPDFLPHVFEYFRQADSTTTRKFGGLGLGLAIVHHLVELHGGTVQAESPGEEQGATFTVRLPLVQAKTSSPQGGQGSSTHLPHASPLTGVRVLVVDDEPDTRDLIVFILETAGAIVTAAPSAAAALEIFPQLQPDILVSDIGMPDLDGYSLIRQIRALPSGSQVPAIALTAYAGELNQGRAIAAGFQRHLAKPIETRELVSAIAAVLG
ncbi:MAG: response regulator, partial [Cyanobacteria bacterium Co-bin8]|nr:response regulator [Cyanobacteria bacterium Co-bin8]